MAEVETNIAQARSLNQMGPARSSTSDALEMSGLLSEHGQDERPPVTKVTILLDGLPEGQRVEIHSRHSLEEPDVVKGTGEVVE